MSNVEIARVLQEWGIACHNMVSCSVVVALDGGCCCAASRYECMTVERFISMFRSQLGQHAVVVPLPVVGNMAGEQKVTAIL